mmetsp:Transcript_21840/g.50963  ORF Transcript_21840/g.50963 Transcript_21840/m.50963 type:complete len:124 (+) Transcript_21840:593-964(+)
MAAQKLARCPAQVQAQAQERAQTQARAWALAQTCALVVFDAPKAKGELKQRLLGVEAKAVPNACKAPKVFGDGGQHAFWPLAANRCCLQLRSNTSQLPRQNGNIQSTNTQLVRSHGLHRSALQ